VNPGIPRFTVLANSKPVAHASELLSSDSVKELVVELRERYEQRVVIFDLPPVLTSDDAIAFMPQVDCALLVIGSGITTKSEVDDSQRLLASTNVLGTVLNMADDCNRSAY
jgi:Mrp family chromosome partitioning ATPase